MKRTVLPLTPMTEREAVAMAQLAIQTKIEAVIKAQGSADTASKAHGNKKKIVKKKQTWTEKLDELDAQESALREKVEKLDGEKRHAFKKFREVLAADDARRKRHVAKEAEAAKLAALRTPKTPLNRADSGAAPGSEAHGKESEQKARHQHGAAPHAKTQRSNSIMSGMSDTAGWNKPPSAKRARSPSPAHDAGGPLPGAIPNTFQERMQYQHGQPTPNKPPALLPMPSPAVVQQEAAMTRPPGLHGAAPGVYHNAPAHHHSPHVPAYQQPPPQQWGAPPMHHHGHWDQRYIQHPAPAHPAGYTYPTGAAAYGAGAPVPPVAGQPYSQAQAQVQAAYGTPPPRRTY